MPKQLPTPLSRVPRLACVRNLGCTREQYTVLESNQPTELRRPSAAPSDGAKGKTVREEGFEPAASRSQAERSTKLSYTLIEPVGKTGVEPAFSCFRRTRPLHLAHFPILPAPHRRFAAGIEPAFSRLKSGRPTNWATRRGRSGVERGQSVRRDLNPRVLVGNQTGYR